MNKILEKALIKKYPKIFRDMYGDRRKTCMAWGCDCGDGWYHLLNTLCASIQEHIDYRRRCSLMGFKDEPAVPQVVFRQVKEKFGALRIYFNGGDVDIRSIVAFTETLSRSICENCGAMNEEVGRTKGWIQSLCPICATEYKKPIVQNKKELALWKKVRASRKNPIRSWKGVDELTPEDFKQPKPIKKRKK